MLHNPPKRSPSLDFHFRCVGARLSASAISSSHLHPSTGWHRKKSGKVKPLVNSQREVDKRGCGSCCLRPTKLSSCGIGFHFSQIPTVLATRWLAQGSIIMGRGLIADGKDGEREPAELFPRKQCRRSKTNEDAERLGLASLLMYIYTSMLCAGAFRLEDANT